MLKGADVDICKERETLDVIRRVIHTHILHIALTDCLALDTTEVNNLFLGVFTDDLGKSYTSPFPYPAPANLGR